MSITVTVNPVNRVIVSSANGVNRSTVSETTIFSGAQNANLVSEITQIANTANAALAASSNALPLAGGTMTGSIAFSNPANANLWVGPIQTPNGIDLFANNNADWAQLNYANINFVYVEKDYAGLNTTNTGIFLDDLQKTTSIVVDGHNYVFSNVGLTFNDGSVINSSNLIYSTANVANTVNAAIVVIQDVDVTQNTWIASNSIIAHSGFTQANFAYSQANTATGTAIAGFAQANTATNIAMVAFGQANTASNIATGAFAQANAGFTVANTASSNTVSLQGGLNTANANISVLFGIETTQNTWISSNAAFTQAAFNTANTATTNITNIQGVDNTQNTWIASNSVYSQASFAQANAANILAQGAYNNSNTKFSSSGGTITGSVSITNDLTVTGNIFLSGNATTINTSSIVINDPLIYLGNNNFISDTVDIGFIGHYNNAGNAHTGLIRDPNLKEYIFFKDYTPEVESNNLINIADPSFAKANVYAAYFKGNVVANTVVINGTDIVSFANSAYNVANLASANSVALQGAMNTANSNISAIQGVDVTQNTWISSNAAFTQAAYNQANTGTTLAQNAYNWANTVNVFTQAAYAQSNSAVANTITTQGVDATQNSWISSNSAYSQAGFAVANSASSNTITLQGGLNTANTNISNIQGVDVTQNTWISSNAAFTQAAFNQANSATSNTIVTQGVDATQNTLITNIQSVDATQNTWISANSVYSQAGFAVANSASSNTVTLQGGLNTANANIAVLFGIETTQNTWISANAAYTQAAYNQANSATTTAQAAFNTANTDVTNISIAGGTYGSSSLVPVITVAANGRITAVSNIAVTGGGGGSANGYNTTYAPYSGILYANAFGSVVQTSGNITLPLASASSAGGKINFYSQGTYTITVNNISTEFIYSGSGSVIGTSNRSVTLYEGETLELTTRGGTEWDITGGTAGLKYQPQANVRVISFSDGTTQSTAASGAATDQTARNLANTANATAQAAFNTANTASANITSLYGIEATQNTSITNIQGVDNTQNTWISANAAFTQAAYNQANTGTTLAQNAYNAANSEPIGTAAFAKANSANVLAQAAFDNSNTKFSSSGGTISGSISVTQDVTVTGNLNVLGTSTTINTSSVILNDPLIYLANNNYTSDAVDIGFIGHYYDTQNAHTGLIRDPNLKEYIFFKGYTPEVQSNNLINISDPSFAYANVYASYVKANIIGNSVVVNGTDIVSFTQAAYNSANTNATNITNIQGVDTTQNTWISANAAFTQSAYNQANAAFNKANTGGTGSALVYTASNTKPSTANTGDQWYYIAADVLYEYITDGTSNTWVDITGPTIATNSSVISSNTYTAQYLLSGTTTGNTATEIFINGVSGARVPISANVVNYYTADVVARRTDTTGEYAAFMLKGAASNTSGTVADVGSIYEIVVARTDSNYLSDVRANNTYKSINMYVTGDTGRTINWKVIVTVLEV